jgi:glycosyltransferase involved in cell wall biosynthesis
VVIPTRNRRSSLEVAVRSVLDQSVGDLEVVVADDGSTDGTTDLLDSLARQDPRVRHVRSEVGRGAQAARNAGIQAAAGQWIAFLDSDDEYLPDSLARRLEGAGGTASVVHSECLARTPDGVVQRFGVPRMSGDVHGALLAQPGPVFPSLLVRAPTLSSIGPLDESLVSYQEWDTSIRLARVARFAFVAEPTFVYATNRLDSISADAAKAARGYEQVVRKHWMAMLRSAGPKLLSHHLGEAAGLQSLAGRRGAAVARLAAATLLWPFAIKSHAQRARQVRGHGHAIESRQG